MHFYQALDADAYDVAHDGCGLEEGLVYVDNYLYVLENRMDMRFALRGFKPIRKIKLHRVKTLRNSNRPWRCHLLYHTSHNYPHSRIATNDVFVAWGFNTMRFNAKALGRGDATCYTIHRTTTLTVA